MSHVGEASGRRPKPLKPVGLTDDGFGVLLSGRAGASPTHVLRIDRDLVDLLEEARGRLPPPEEPGKSLSPRQIQTLLRRGETVDDVARRAGVPVSWVERFAPPIEWERAGMVERARHAIFHRPRLGPSGLPLGDAVRARVPLDDEMFEAAWDAVRAAEDPEEWIITFRYRSRGARRKARWAYRPRSDDVRALDHTAALLAWSPPAGEQTGVPVRTGTGGKQARRAAPGPVRRTRRRSSG